MRKLLLFAAAGLLAASCSNSTQTQDQGAAQAADPNKIEITNDMENAAAMIPSWINEVNVVKMENGPAHSGEFVSKVDDKSLYSYAYREYFENINNKLPKRIVVNGWVNSPDPGDKLGLVMDINEDNVSYLWKSYSLTGAVAEPNKWFEFTAYFPIDKPVKPNHQVKIFGFGGGKVAYFDDLRITFEY